MKPLGRRGEARWALEDTGRLIVLAVSLLVLLSVIYMIGKRVIQSDQAKLDLCRGTLAAKVSANELLKGRPGAAFGHACRTIEKTLPTDGETREDVMRDFARLAANAWYETLEGETLNIFDETEGRLGFITVEEVGCFPAYILNVEHTHAFVRGDSIAPGDLEEFMRTEPYYHSEGLLSGEALTYLDYIQYGGAGPGFVAIMNPIEPDTNYIIAVISPSKFKNSRYIPGPLKTFIDGWGQESEHAANSILVVREDELAEVCRPI